MGDKLSLFVCSLCCPVPLAAGSGLSARFVNGRTPVAFFERSDLFSMRPTLGGKVNRSVVASFTGAHTIKMATTIKKDKIRLLVEGTETM